MPLVVLVLVLMLLLPAVPGCRPLNSSKLSVQCSCSAACMPLLRL